MMAASAGDGTRLMRGRPWNPLLEALMEYYSHLAPQMRKSPPQCIMLMR